MSLTINLHRHGTQPFDEIDDGLTFESLALIKEREMRNTQRQKECEEHTEAERGREIHPQNHKEGNLGKDLINGNNDSLG